MILGFAVIAAFFMASLPHEANAKTTRIKDIVDFEGVRDNQLVGYGLVVGLNGTGDSLNNAPFTEQSLVSMLERLGVSTRGQNLNTGNVAAVMVTATLPPFTNQGAQIDITVSAFGDAESLRGGTLLVTPLMAADGEVYAVAQGPVAISGFTVEGQAGNVTQNIPTTGRVPNGGIVEREIDFKLEDLQEVRLSLRNPDFTTARRISQAINGFMSTNVSSAENSASVVLRRPQNFDGSIVDLITDIEQLPVQPDQVARVVIDERSGVIVMGSDVRISTVAIAQANLTVSITETPQVSQPNPFAEQGETVVVPRTDIEINSGEANLALIETGVTLQDLVTGLNRLGVAPGDIITILQAIKAAGALQAEIETL
ncbi:MAG: flagellar basal body P-ring protein FlgI [Alphaproteobacteria bacterium]|nr:flagellar basal body P-ring protein FlgI [Alphaproteobacteria bacterium]NCQ87583.1 flagellar basal body P-ring protein FlgI [Alphaproteobacteria bacterium]NCT06452.1 flagellar basal body P-ring protein FlgI [Alphaproteobacteria bacterium]